MHMLSWLLSYEGSCNLFNRINVNKKVLEEQNTIGLSLLAILHCIILKPT